MFLEGVQSIKKERKLARCVLTQLVTEGCPSELSVKIPDLRCSGRFLPVVLVIILRASSFVHLFIHRLMKELTCLFIQISN